MSPLETFSVYIFHFNSFLIFVGNKTVINIIRIKLSLYVAEHTTCAQPLATLTAKSVVESVINALTKLDLGRLLVVFHLFINFSDFQL